MNPALLTYVPTDWQEEVPGGHEHRDVADVCVDAEDRVYLYTRFDSEVLVYDRNGRYLRSWGRGIFANSHGITAGPDGSIYCADNRDHTVRKFDPRGELVLTLGAPGVASDTGYDGRNLQTVRCGAGPFNCCTKLAVAPNGDLYVADGYGNARVHQFSPRGELLRSWGEPGTGPGQFHLPHGIWVAADGRVLVADRENDRIQFFSPDGEYLGEWTDVRRPCSIQIDAQGTIYVVELSARANRRSYVHGIDPQERSGRVSIFGPDGDLRARWGKKGTAAGEFIAPHGLAVDSRGDLYVSEVTWTLYGQVGEAPAGYRQIQKFSRAMSIDPRGGTDI